MNEQSVKVPRSMGFIITNGMRNISRSLISNPDQPTIRRRVQLHDSMRSPQDEDFPKSSLSEMIDRSEKRCPRVWNILFVVVFPLLLLIGWAILCGYILALMESGEELKRNDETVVKFLNDSLNLNDTLDELKNSYDTCLDAFNSSSQQFNKTELISHMEKCTKDGVSRAEGKAKEIINKTGNELIATDMSFDWNTCSGGSYWESTEIQGLFVFNEWMQSYESLKENCTSQSMNDTCVANARKGASGVSKCRLNAAGGAVFWFTIMTTIGYGNTSPVTSGGRTLVITLGFFSIMGFTACIGSASYVLLVIVDDLFKRLNLRILVRGWISVLFWLTILMIWTIAIAVITVAYMRVRYGDDLAIRDAIWFAYISIMTVGLGDYHIPHTKFSHDDMFWVPACMLIGFVLFANFLLKLSDAIKLWTKRKGITDDESLDYLLRLTRNRPIQDDEIDVGLNSIDSEANGTDLKIDCSAMPNEVDGLGLDSERLGVKNYTSNQETLRSRSTRKARVTSLYSGMFRLDEESSDGASDKKTLGCSNTTFLVEKDESNGETSNQEVFSGGRKTRKEVTFLDDKDIVQDRESSTDDGYR